MKIAVTADVHLNEKHKERFDAFKNIVNLVRNKNIKYLIVAGDLFDQDDTNYPFFDEYCIFSRSSYEKAGVALPENIKGNNINCYEAAAPFADLIIAVNTPSNNVTKQLMSLPGLKSHKQKVVSMSIPEGESPSYIESARILNDELTKHFA